MLRARSLFTVTVLCIVFLSTVNVKAEDQDQQCYTLSSLRGSYSIIGHYGASLAMALTSARADGKGNFSSTFVVNEPDPSSTTGGRKLVKGSQTGTYTINCDGTGVITRLVTLSSGATGTVVSDLIITRAVHSEDGGLVATEVVDAQRTPSFIVPGGIFLTRTYTRLPD